MTRQNRSVRLANCLRLALWQQDRRGCCACRLPPLAGSSLRHGGHTRRAARGRAAGRRGRAARARWRARGRWRQSRRRARGPDRRATPGARSPAGAAPPRSGRSPSWSAGARLRGPRVQGRVSLAHPAHVSKVSTAARQAAGSRLLREPLARAGLQAGGRRAAPGLRPAHCRPAAAGRRGDGQLHARTGEHTALGAQHGPCAGPPQERPPVATRLGLRPDGPRAHWSRRAETICGAAARPRRAAARRRAARAAPRCCGCPHWCHCAAAAARQPRAPGGSEPGEATALQFFWSRTSRSCPSPQGAAQYTQHCAPEGGIRRGARERARRLRAAG